VLGPGYDDVDSDCLRPILNHSFGPDGIGHGDPLLVVSALHAGRPNVDPELNARGMSVRDLRENGFEVLDRFLQWD
jgi:hypothetical protein